MFHVTIPASRAAERRYVLHVILEEFLGLDYRVEELTDAKATRIHREGSDSTKALALADELLADRDGQWLKQSSLPQIPLKKFVPPAELGFAGNYSAPTLYTGASVETSKADFAIRFDLLGSAFFLLTRYEEVVSDARDRFGRFEAKESVAGKAEVLNRPLVDEYVEVLRRAIEFVWPGTEFKKHDFRIVPTHDVDVPYDYLFLPAWRAFRRSCARVALQKSFSKGVETFQTWRRVRSGDDLADPYFKALVRLMEMNEQAGLRGWFYFICGHTSKFDGEYDIDHPRIRKLLRTIHKRGHYIGLHPSFGTLGNVGLLKEEFGRLRRVCDEEGITQDIWSVRSHYLRWDSRHSFSDFDEVGFDVDSTLSFAEHAGFRCGTCREYTTFDLRKRKQLKLKERPLIAMEVSVLQPYYQGLKFAEASAYFRKLRESCRAASGQFVFLWHNSRFESSDDWELYRQQVADA